MNFNFCPLYIDADYIGRKAVTDFIDSLLGWKSVFHNPIKFYNLKNYWGWQGQEIV